MDEGQAKLRWHDRMMNVAVGGQIALLGIMACAGDEAAAPARWASMACSACALAYCAVEVRRSGSKLNAALAGVAPLLVCAGAGIVQLLGS